jgi:hypothetical protein
MDRSVPTPENAFSEAAAFPAAAKLGDRRMLGIRPLVVVVAMLTSLIAGTSTALADTSGGGNSEDGGGDSGKGAYTCSDTPAGPGVLMGTHSSVLVKGACLVNSGRLAIVRHNLTILPGGVLNAAFGGSDLTVGGNIDVRAGGILVLGCEPFAFTCFNDPSQTGGTLSTHDTVGGNLVARGAMMVLAHNNSIKGDVNQSGGGGGVNCTTFPLGPPPNGPVAYSTYEDNTIGGKASITGLQSCWLGFIRNKVDDSVSIINDKLADPDAIEINSNHIMGDLNCRGNSFVWDSSEANFGQTALWPRKQAPNTVDGERTGQCDVLQNPVNEGGAPGPRPF